MQPVLGFVHYYFVTELTSPTCEVCVEVMQEILDRIVAESGNETATTFIIAGLP